MPNDFRGLVRRDGTWIVSQRFGPYGVRTAADSSGSGPGFELRYRWTGREWDAETGWYYFRARYLDPAQRRFVQEDPIGYAGGANVYMYVGGNPIEARDPSGLRLRLEAYATNPNPPCIGMYCTGFAVYIDGAPVRAGGVGAFYLNELAAYQRNMAFAELAFRQIASELTDEGGQGLTEEQRASLGNFCSVNEAACDRVQLTTNCGRVSCLGNTVTWGGAINFQGGTDLSRTDQAFIALLAHELQHVVQWLNSPMNYNLSMLWTWTLGRIFNPDPYYLGNDWQLRQFSSFTREQQGAIVGLCYNGSSSACQKSGYSGYQP